mgnify:CR=1 FL=1
MFFKCNKLKGKIALKDIKFEHSYFKTPVSVDRGDILLDGTKISMNSLVAQIDNTPVFLNVSLWDLDKTLKVSGYFTTKFSEYFANKYINSFLTYPIKPKGDITITADISGNINNLRIRPKMKFAPESDIYYMGANLGDESEEREINADINVTSNNVVYLKNLEYLRFMTSQNSRAYPITVLYANGIINLTKNKKDIYAPTSALKPMELPFKENNICFPAWLFDPFRGERNNYSTYPGSKMGSDHNAKYDTKQKRESRIIPILSELSSKKAEQPIGNLELYAGGEYKGSAVATFDLPPTVTLKKPESQQALSNIIHYLLEKPKIIATKINTCVINEKIRPQLHITVKNPLSQTVRGKLNIEIAGKLSQKADLTIAPLEVKECYIPLPEIPEDFPFQHFTWQITLKNNGNETDVFCDSVDVKKAMLYAFRHLVRNQQFYPDGRISHHYFGDAYGVRAMFAYLHFLQNGMSCLKSNDDFQLITPKEIEDCAFRFYDMLADRQTEDGKLPMGYLEHSDGYNVADGGQITLAIAQSLPYITDYARKEKYQKLCSRFLNWAETFYIDSIRSAQLKISDPQGKADEGMYGLGEYGRKKVLTGPSWVGADILAVQLCMGALQKDATRIQYQAIAKRNANYYVKAVYPASGYYQAEALFWVRSVLNDHNLNEIIDSNLKRTFIPPLLKGCENEMYLRGGRCTLNALPLLYYKRNIQDSPEVRAILLKYIWAFGSESSFGSMKRLSENYPKAVHGESLTVSKYAALSALWAMELLVPGSTLLPEMRKP